MEPASSTCSHLFVTSPTVSISNVSFLDIGFVSDSRAFGECPINVTVAFQHQGGTDVSSVTLIIRIVRTNQVPLFAIVSPVINVLESSGNYSIFDFATNLSAGFGDSDQNMSFVIEEVYSTSNRVSSSQVFDSRPFVNPAGRLTFNIFPYVYGAFVFALRLSDAPGTSGLQARNSSASFFYINVLSVNDRPVFTLTSPVLSLASSSQPQLEVRSIFQTISPGPNEDDQSVSCSIKGTSTARNELFVVQPIMVGGGSLLSFQLAPQALGVANYTVVCFDDGNSMYGGQNQSLPANIAIMINRPNVPPFFEMNQTVFAINSSSILSSFSFQPFTIYSPSRGYVKNSVSQFSGSLMVGNTSLSSVISQNSRFFDPLTQLLPLSSRRRTSCSQTTAPRALIMVSLPVSCLSRNILRRLLGCRFPLS